MKDTCNVKMNHLTVTSPWILLCLKNFLSKLKKCWDMIEPQRSGSRMNRGWLTVKLSFLCFESSRFGTGLGGSIQNLSTNGAAWGPALRGFSQSSSETFTGLEREVLCLERLLRGANRLVHGALISHLSISKTQSSKRNFPLCPLLIWSMVTADAGWSTDAVGKIWHRRPQKGWCNATATGPVMIGSRMGCWAIRMGYQLLAARS